ncbi:DUF669 domain-containing protein [Azospirillaceae bacterium]
MSLLDLNVKDAVDLEAVVEGEYMLRVVAAELQTSKKGNQMLMVRFEIVDAPTAKDINYYLLFPSEDDDAKRKNLRLLSFKNLYKALGVDSSGPVEVEELVGLEGSAFLGVEESDEYGEQNRIKKFS